MGGGAGVLFRRCRRRCNPVSRGCFYRFRLRVVIQMVARDGIEPPTPAFSGPRSTTELSGLGTQAKRLIRGSPRTPGRTSVASAFSGELVAGGEPATQTQIKYSNSNPFSP